MKPYYQDSAVTIYHGDCREVLPGLSADVLVTDPPYGIAHPTDYARRGRGSLAGTRDFAPVHGDAEPFDPGPILGLGLPSVIWGANHFASRLPDSPGWLVWDKRVQEGVGVNDQSDAELAWTNCVRGVRVFRHMWNGFWRDSERGVSLHPTQKPETLMSWALSWCPDGVVLDPYCGSGPVVAAAKKAGRKAIGIEIEERYCEIAARRCAQEVMSL